MLDMTKQMGRYERQGKIWRDHISFPFKTFYFSGSLLDMTQKPSSSTTGKSWVTTWITRGKYIHLLLILMAMTQEGKEGHQRQDTTYLIIFFLETQESKRMCVVFYACRLVFFLSGYISRTFNMMWWSIHCRKHLREYAYILLKEKVKVKKPKIAFLHLLLPIDGLPWNNHHTTPKTIPSNHQPTPQGF